MGKSRLPALIATAVAVPVAAVAGIAAFNAFEPSDDGERLGGDLAPVSVVVPELSDDQAVVCLALTASAPAELAGLPARPVEGGAHASEFAAAYGDPAVVIRCGAEAVEVDPAAPVFVLNGVCWFSELDGEGTEWITADREVPVAVTVPEDHQASDVLNELSVALGSAVPAVEDPLHGCA